jgi:hypothetical protein
MAPLGLLLSDNTPFFIEEDSSGILHEVLPPASERFADLETLDTSNFVGDTEFIAFVDPTDLFEELADDVLAPENTEEYLPPS